MQRAGFQEEEQAEFGHWPAVEVRGEGEARGDANGEPEPLRGWRHVLGGISAPGEVSLSDH